MGAKIVDYESHMAYKCDLYADFKAILITRLNISPPIENTHLNNPELTLFIDTTADIVNLHYKPLLTKSTVLIEQNLDYIDAPTLQTVYMYIVPTTYRGSQKSGDLIFLHNLDKWLEDPQNNFQLSTTSKCQTKFSQNI